MRIREILVYRPDAASEPGADPDIDMMHQLANAFTRRGQPKALTGASVERRGFGVLPVPGEAGSEAGQPASPGTCVHDPFETNPEICIVDRHGCRRDHLT
jgi:hypothetical protein